MHPKGVYNGMEVRKHARISVLDRSLEISIQHPHCSQRKPQCKAKEVRPRGRAFWLLSTAFFPPNHLELKCVQRLALHSESSLMVYLSLSPPRPAFYFQGGWWSSVGFSLGNLKKGSWWEWFLHLELLPRIHLSVSWFQSLGLNSATCNRSHK